MTNEMEHDADDSVDAASIGVGMGGSCPVCRAPVDLGQEFCLECGSPIRFTPRQRRQQRSAAARAGDAAPVAPTRSFPWIPFLIVLALVVGGVAFALVGNSGDKPAKSKDTTTKSALPNIGTGTDTTGSTQTTTLQDCDASQSATGSPPSSTDPTSSSPTGADAAGDPSSATDAATFPTTADPNAASNGFQESTPTTGGDDTSGQTVTVDQNGNLCPATDGTDPSVTNPVTTPTNTTTPSTPTNTTSSTGSTETTTSSTGDWPAGKSGWTVIIAGYPTANAANDKSADVQESGFDSGVLYSSDYVSLCPGYYVVFSGVFDSKSAAEDHVDELEKKSYAGMYVREVRKTGAHATCDNKSAHPQN